jgi:hypothetical protein
VPYEGECPYIEEQNAQNHPFERLPEIVRGRKMAHKIFISKEQRLPTFRNLKGHYAYVAVEKDQRRISARQSPKESKSHASWDSKIILCYSQRLKKNAKWAGSIRP